MKILSFFLCFLWPQAQVKATCSASDPQSIDGTCNNLANPQFGASFTTYRRGPEGAEFLAGGVSPVDDRPDPRVVSNRLGAEDPASPAEDEIPHNMLAVMFGQFINHDFENNDKKDLFVTKDEDPFVFAQDLIVPDIQNDAFCFFPPGSPNNRCLPGQGPYVMEYRTSAGVIENGQFEVTNRGTSYLDLGTIYGNTAPNATVLRTGTGGKLLTSDYSGNLFFLQYSFQDLPPSRTETGLNTDTLVLRYPDNEILTHGDFRCKCACDLCLRCVIELALTSSSQLLVNNNVALAAFHTLFMREHNYQADLYLQQNPLASDEEVYQAARRRNIAQYQKIVLEDYLPAEFGQYFTDIVGTYGGYDDTVDATTGAVFAGAAFRYGHSSLRQYAPLSECGDVSTVPLPPFVPPGSDLPNLGQVGGPINILGMASIAGGLESVFRGLVAKRTRPVDVKVTDAVRNIALPGGFRIDVGVDVYSFDLQRGRLNGVPNYDRVREVYHPAGSMYGSQGCGKNHKSRPSKNDPYSCFLRLVTGNNPSAGTQEDFELATNLRDLYGKINKIDAIVGMLAEPHVPGTSFGETLGRVVADQYQRARDGDRFWYESVYDASEQAEVKSVTIKTLLERHFDLDHLPEESFLAPADFAAELASTCSP